MTKKKLHELAEYQAGWNYLHTNHETGEVTIVNIHTRKRHIVKVAGLGTPKENVVSVKTEDLPGVK